MGMYHSTSGKHGYAYVTPSKVITIPRQVMKQILMRENELRLAKEVII